MGQHAGWPALLGWLRAALPHGHQGSAAAAGRKGGSQLWAVVQAHCGTTRELPCGVNELKVAGHTEVLGW